MGYHLPWQILIFPIIHVCVKKAKLFYNESSYVLTHLSVQESDNKLKQTQTIYHYLFITCIATAYKRSRTLNEPFTSLKQLSI